MTGQDHGEPPRPDVPPQQPPTPQGFGPAPQPYTPAAPVRAPRRGLRGERAAVVAALAAAALALAGFGWAALGGAGGDPEPSAGGGASASPPASPSAPVDKGDGKGTGSGPDTVDPNTGIKPGEAPVWLVENRVEVAGAGARQYGPWRVGEVVVRALDKEVTGYGAADGREKWKVQLETPVCGVPKEPAAGGKLIVAVREGQGPTTHCNALQQIDLAAGKAGWKVPVPKENDYDTALDLPLAVSGDTVAVARSAVMSGFSATDGRKLFGTSKTGGCYPVAFGGGARLVLVRQCPDPGGAPGAGRALLEEVDPATGAAKWGHTFESGWTVGRVLSADPLVAAAYHSGRKVWSLTAFTADGKVRSHGEVPFGTDKRCNGWGDGSRELGACPAAVADADTLYLAGGTPGRELGIDLTDHVIAVDLASGKEKWRAKAPDGRRIWPLALEDGRVVAYLWPEGKAAGAMAALKPADGALEVFLQSPAGAAGAQEVFFSHGAHTAWAGGRLFLLNGRVKSPEPGLVHHALLSFGK
ncbi:PQQ-binding-like beta-propeller repeat protein [Streptomyces toxytricini]|uniref:PQQ-binding-like beta-propeller repeat protein n=1 Tax=Streptomyces toxytricini TaxID=67369 RepID=A0ABW8EN90_STRT5